MKVLVIFEKNWKQRDICLGRYLTHSGVQARFLYKTGDPAIEIQRRQGVWAEGLPFHGRCDIISILRLRKILRQFQPDIIHAYRPKLAWLAILAQWPRKKARLILHRGAIRNLNRLSPSDLLLFFCNQIDAYACITDAVGKSLIQYGVSKEKVKKIFLGFNPNLPDGDKSLNLESRSNRIRLGAIANYRKVKGLEYLVDAMDILSGRGLDIELIIIGRDQNGRLAKYISHSRARDRIRSTGWMQHPWDLLRTFDCCVIPSLSEGMSQVAVEAMICGIPIVATNVGGLGEVIQHGVNGLLVPAQNPKALADAILTVVQNPELSDQFRKNGIKTFNDQFTIEQMCSRLVDLYRQLAEK